MSKINMATLFSGVGAPEQGALRVYDNVNMVFACEFDKFARESFMANYDVDPKHFHKDVKDLDASTYQQLIDILIGGSPCQDFSIAGALAGWDGARGSLTWEYLRVVKECLPSVIVYENVKNLTGKKFMKGFLNFTNELSKLGYHIEYKVVNTKNYGVPQNRERVYLVGFLDEEVYKRFVFAEEIPLKKRLKDVLEGEVEVKYYLSQKALDGYKSHSARHLDQGNGFKFEPTHGGGTAMCINNVGLNRQTDNYLLMAIPDVIKPLCNVNPCGHGMNGEVFDMEGNSPTLTTNKGGGIKIAGMLDMKGMQQIKRVYETGGYHRH